GNRRVVSPAHEPQRNQHPPVHRGDRGPRLVGPEAHAGRGQPRRPERFEHAPGQLQLRRQVEPDRRRDAVQLARDAARHDHTQSIREVHVVGRGHDDDLGSRRCEEASELLHPCARDGRHLTLVGRAGFGDRDPSVRRDGGKHQRHYFTSPPCRGGRRRKPPGAGTARDDAAVYRIAPDRALVATVDFFTPIVDDPFEFGAIAAANSLSDVYAVGARPLFALGITAFPRGKLGTGLLEKIVSGGASKLGEAGVPVVGGHSVDDPEPKFGYTVIGEVHPDRMVGHEGARAGDGLYLTKPLGTGLVTTAIKRGLCPPDLERAAVAFMTTLNRLASEAMVAAGATAATDVTGYGLIGHLANLKGGADVELGAVPFMPGVRD